MENFDIHEFAKMFDAALASDNPSVKKALRNFMMIAAIVHAADDHGEERLMGPLETLVKKVADLERMVYELQNNRTFKDKYYKEYYNNPTWVYSPNTSTTGVTTGTAGTSWQSYNSVSISDYAKEIQDLMGSISLSSKDNNE